MLLDTCVVSELRRPDGSHAVKAFVAALPTEKMLLSVITIGEITKGVAVLPDGERKYRLAAWLHTLSSQFAHRILSLDQETAGNLGRAYRRWPEERHHYPDCGRAHRRNSPPARPPDRNSRHGAF